MAAMAANLFGPFLLEGLFRPPQQNPQVIVAPAPQNDIMPLVLIMAAIAAVVVIQKPGGKG